MNEASVLVVSYPSLRQVNRDVYSKILSLGYNLAVVAPLNSRVGSVVSKADDPSPGDPPMHFLERVGQNPRLARFRGLTTLVKQTKPQVIYLEADPISLQALELGLLQAFGGRKLVCLSCDNVHRPLRAEVFQGPRIAIRALFLTVLLLLVRPLVNHVFCISNDILDVMKKRGFGDRCSVIPLGFPKELFYVCQESRLTTRKKLRIDNDELVIGYFGRVIPSKGIDILIRAMHQLLDHQWKLLIDEFGQYSDPYQNEIAKMLADPQIASRVIRFDAKHNEMPEYMNATDVVVLASIGTKYAKEQYGRVIPEAMACGCCAVVSNCGALPELVGESGVVVPQGDPKKLADALRDLLVDSERRKHLSEAAAADALSRLSSDSQAQLICKLLNVLFSPC